MANWKELGVVPDSDDENWDPEDDLQQTFSTFNTPPKPQTKQQNTLASRNDDVWEFPGSPSSPPDQVSNLQRAQSPNLAPRSSCPSSVDASQLGAAQQTSATIPSAEDSADTLHQKQGIPDPLAGVPTEDRAHGGSSDRRDDISPADFATTAPSVDPFSTIFSEPFIQDDSPEKSHQKEPPIQIETSATSRSADTPPPTASEPPARGRRSLRPRKPIQEHPYLLENAQYSTTFKSHGLKPIRVAVNEQAAVRRRHGEDSQDTEYAGDASQSGGADEESQERVRMTTHNTHRELDDDLDELALSLSPRTSSPQARPRASSEQSPGQHTDDTSIHEDEDLPDIRDLISTRKTMGPAKRRMPPEPSTSRKRIRLKPSRPDSKSPKQVGFDAWDRPRSQASLSPTRRIRNIFSPDDSPGPPFRTGAVNHTAMPPSQLDAPRRPQATADPVDLTALITDSEKEEPSDESSSDSESDLIRRTGRRIRGVLPASWLRLDQQVRKQKSKSTTRRPSSPCSPEQLRQGLASRKTGPSKPTVSTRTFLDELIEDEEYEVQPTPKQAVSDPMDEQDLGDGGHLDLDDNASLVEEDYIDQMLPGQKRNRLGSAGPPRKRNRMQQKIFKGQKRYRQPKISEAVHRLGRSVDSATKSRVKQRPSHRLGRAISPPALSIVDFIEPTAPKFIKVAARTARKRTNMGRSKPSHKSINLGNRPDNLDALGVLQSWHSGKLKPRAPRAQVAARQQKPSRNREPLRPVASNTRRPAKLAAGLSFHQPQRLTRQASTADSMSIGKTGPSTNRQPVIQTKVSKIKTRPRNQGLSCRPAQLEAEMLQDDDDDVVFGARKKMLDLVFRKSRKEMMAPAFELRRSSPEQEPQNEASKHLSKRSDVGMLPPVQLGDSTSRYIPRPRKRISPRRLDLDAPQYIHANDPLPFSGSPSTSAEEDLQPHGKYAQKIIGLGPFGTHYTQNFDVFPLNRDTFFHDSTIIGNGTLGKTLDYEHSQALTSDRPTLSFDFSDKRFEWGKWTATTSSELGLLFDAIADDIKETGETDRVNGAPRAVVGAGNVLNYVLKFVAVDNGSELKSFTERMLELLDGFMSHALESTSSAESSRLLVQVTSRYLMCALVLLRNCQGSVELLSKIHEAETVLRRLAKLCIDELLSIGTSELRAAYTDLQRLGIRERGIRADNFTMISWVVVIKVLKYAQIPRTGFWDLISSTKAADVTHVNDVQSLDSLWRDIFTLLPLTEFDDAGILSQGQRHAELHQDLVLPQKLLKVVFESYQANERQSPTFNDYCRALLGRCHCLIEQWGWTRCGGVIGTIFDFFGGRKLSHLRNEEVYDSPRFLDNLNDGRPCISVEPADRCFHIFLKILAVAIRKMRHCGHAKDIQNLIARCLPNHSRQYSKEMDIHSHDLASLRNHHDLLCTLFWAAPADLRKPVELIQRLVDPNSSHKEACLINLRAWNQLTRFVVASGCSIQEYRPFVTWQNNVFQPVLNQYLSAATDVEHQFMSMAKEDRGQCDQPFRDSLVAANQRALKDVLHFSVRASLDVLKHCPSLTAATFSFNVNQMTKVFSKLSGHGTVLDWRILRDCFDTVDVFVEQVEKLWRRLRESSSDSVLTTSSQRELEDGVEFLDDKIISSFMAAVRKAIDSPACNEAEQSAATAVEKAIVLCGRIAIVLIDVGKCSLVHFFSAGKHSLFKSLPKDLTSTEWRFVPLFVATLLKNHFFDFSSLGCTHFDIWMSCLVRPSHALRYGIHLAETLRTLDLAYMKVSGSVVGTALDYDRNRRLFANGISHMRRELRQADFAQRKLTKAKYDTLLRVVMQQIKSDIKSFRLNSAEHSNYINFVREIVGLIKSHGSDFCAIDPFFYQVSAEYSPPREDPQMHTAGILAYGIKLGEGERTAIPQLFSFLYNHFKTSLSNGQLDAESKIVEHGMKDDNILGFVVGCMLPAIIRASSYSNDIWPLLDTYSKALQDGLARSCLPREIPENSVDHVIALLTAALDWTRYLRESSTQFTAAQAHIFTELLGICNAVRPSLASWLQQESATDSRLRGCVAKFTRIAKQAATVLGQLRASKGGEIRTHDVRVEDLIRVEEQQIPIVVDSHVHGFTQNLVREVQNSWIVTADTVTVRVAATPTMPRGTQATQGVSNNLHSRVGLLSELLGGLTAWVSEMDEHHEEFNQRRTRGRRRHVPLAFAIDPF